MLMDDLIAEALERDEALRMKKDEHMGPEKWLDKAGAVIREKPLKLGKGS